MPIFYGTIGVQYAIERHPRLPRDFTPDDVIVIKADDELEARRQMFDLLGREWSGLYSEQEWDPIYFPGRKVPIADCFPDGMQAADVS